NSMLVVANIKESGGFSTSLASKILNNQNAINTLINDINNTIKEKNYHALCIDFEYVNEDEKNLYTEFIKKVKEGIKDKKLFVALAPKNSDEQKGLLYTAHDYFSLGKIVDYVILMTYEWGYTFGEPMPVAPLDQVRRVIRYAKSKIDESKIIMGVPNYGYDWTLPYQKGSKAESIANVDAINLAKKYNVEIKYDSQSQTPYFNYKKDGKLHVVHFDDACSINAKINLAIDENIKGLSIWTVTTYFPQLILLIDYYFNIEK
ncbi:MAG: glycosyl hydrolase family 18 protein, partial [Bacilli bacterium]|nr:glycosyl hydrolase family 18 protein [Bacilli bacterium]